MFCCHSVPEPCNRGASLLSGRPTQGTVRPPSPKRSPGWGEMQVEKAMQGQGSAVPPRAPQEKDPHLILGSARWGLKPGPFPVLQHPSLLCWGSCRAHPAPGGCRSGL